MLPDSRSVLEPVTGAAAGDPDVLVLRVTVDEEVSAGGVLVLTHATLNQWPEQSVDHR